MFKVHHTLTLVLENSAIGDDNFAPTVVKALREYAALLDASQWRPNEERIDLLDGTILTLTVSTRYEEQEPPPGPRFLRLPDGTLMSDGG